jgi:hypothetical protein
VTALESDNEVFLLLLDKYFALLLIHLYEAWFYTIKPRSALECLVLDFQDSRLIGIFDKKLPALVAGKSELGEGSSSKMDEDQYQSKIKFHKWLGDYAAALLAHDILRGPIL